MNSTSAWQRQTTLPALDGVRAYVMAHGQTGLLIALSDDLPGLVVHGHSLEEVERRLPTAINDIREAMAGARA